jgi:hypothetical protein
MTLRDTHRVMRRWTDLIAAVQAGGSRLDEYLNSLLDLKLRAARSLHIVNLPRRGQHGGRR